MATGNTGKQQKILSLDTFKKVLISIIQIIVGMTLVVVGAFLVYKILFYLGYFWCVYVFHDKLMYEWDTHKIQKGYVCVMGFWWTFAAIAISAAIIMGGKELGKCFVFKGKDES